MNSLEALQRDGIEIDVCRTCRGVWLDRGELEKMLGRDPFTGQPSATIPPAYGDASPPPQTDADNRRPYPDDPRDYRRDDRYDDRRRRRYDDDDDDDDDDRRGRGRGGFLADLFDF